MAAGERLIMRVLEVLEPAPMIVDQIRMLTGARVTNRAIRYALSALVDQGKARKIGHSNYSLPKG